MNPADLTTAPPPDIPAGLEDLLSAFIAEMARDAAKLQALAGGDRNAFAEHVHAMCGKCAMFGERILFERLSRLGAGVIEAPEAEIHRMVEEVVERSLQLAEFGAAPKRA